MEISALTHKASNAVKAGIGICLTPIAVLGVASVAVAVFILDRFDRMGQRHATLQGRAADAN